MHYGRETPRAWPLEVWPKMVLEKARWKKVPQRARLERQEMIQLHDHVNAGDDENSQCLRTTTQETTPKMSWDSPK